MKFIVYAVCGILAQIMTTSHFDGTRAEGFISYMLGWIVAERIISIVSRGNNR